jgi:hypothetical protein
MRRPIGGFGSHFQGKLPAREPAGPQSPAMASNSFCFLGVRALRAI